MQASSLFNLKNYHTFGCEAFAEDFIEIKTEADIFLAREPIILQQKKPFVLGGGSNIIFRNTQGLVILYNQLKGIERLSSNRVRVATGEAWHAFVAWSLEQHLYGLENLALIPGTVGGAPIQNIGAYGVDVQAFIEGVEAIDLKTAEKIYFSHYDCQFGYRDSFFKRNPNRYFITHVILALRANPSVNLSYKDLQEAAQGVDQAITPEWVFQKVVEIRTKKLPNPKEQGNAGSFFKNPIVDRLTAQHLKEKIPPAPIFKEGEDYYKIPAAFLIEYCGWKGRKHLQVGVYEKHALILVNQGSATGDDVWVFAGELMSDIYVKTGIQLEIEPMFVLSSSVVPALFCNKIEAN
jgi:UDP-N-acetylmuramate dehydrogenase